MTIDEAIKHCEEVAEAEERSAKLHQRPDSGIKGSGKRYLSCLKCAEEHRQLAEWLRELKELRGQTRWIPVSERLPEDDVEVFVYLFDNSCPHIAWLEDTYWYTEDFEVERENEPVAWMPLPEPYAPDINDGKSNFNQALSKHKASFNQAEEDTDTKVLDEIRAEIEQAADKQFQIAMGVADLNERYTHIQMENAYRHSLNIIDKYRKEAESEEAQPKQTGDSCLDFDFDKVKETLKKDNLDNLIVDHTCEEKQEQTRDEKMIDAIDFAIKVTDSQDEYSMGMRNGMRYVKSLIDDKEPQYELRWSDEEIKLGINLGDEVVSDYGSKGVVVGIDTYKGEVWLSLLMKNHKVPQLVKASWYKTKTGKHFPQIIEVLEQIKGESDGK